LHKKVGDAVQAGEPLATLLVNRTDTLDEVKRRLLRAIFIGNEPVEPPTLIRCIVTPEGIVRP
jgi:pyrimidine-nucleoside phosphorylase